MSIFTSPARLLREARTEEEMKRAVGVAIFWGTLGTLGVLVLCGLAYVLLTL